MKRKLAVFGLSFFGFSSVLALWLIFWPGLCLAQDDDSGNAKDSSANNEAVQAYVAGDYAKAHRLWEEQAATGDPQAMNDLGTLYERGLGQEQDLGRALHWYAEAAKAENPAGMANYGRMLEQGRAVPANPEEGARWLDLAARKGQAEAQYNLGMLYEHGRGLKKDLPAAAAWYSRAAAQQQAQALARLGHFYRLGIGGLAQDRQRATLLLYAAAMSGLADAIAELDELARENPPRDAKGQIPKASLFGQDLAQSTRGPMREALRRAGARQKRVDDVHICDIYAGGNLIPGAAEMAVCYGPADNSRVASSGGVAAMPLAFIKIDYPAQSQARADAVLKMISDRFGQPQALESQAQLWNLGDVIVASQRFAPGDTSSGAKGGLVSLMYMIPAVYSSAARSLGGTAR